MKIISDTMSDVPKEIISKYDVEVIPLIVNINDKEYLDGVNITHEDYYKLLRECSDLPKTSQVTYIRFIEIFEKYTKNGEDVLYIGGSSAASGTHQNSILASRECEGSGKVYTFDTYSLSSCAGLFVAKAGELAKEGKSINEIVSTLESLKGTETAFFSVDDLEFLKKGGRISTTTATIGKLLNIKPILTISDGIVVPHCNVRGKKQMISNLLSSTLEKATDLSNRIVIIGCCDNVDDLEILKEKLLKTCTPKELYVTSMGACISSHSGPSIIGIATI